MLALTKIDIEIADIMSVNKTVICTSSIRKFFSFLLVVSLVILALPCCLYIYGLSLIDERPEPTSLSLVDELPDSYMGGEFGGGERKIYKMTPYTYVALYFKMDKSESYYDYALDYPGTYLSMMTIEKYIRENIGIGYEPSVKTRLAWMANTIWVTNNWSVERLLSTNKVQNDEFKKSHNSQRMDDSYEPPIR